jgi:glycosyltransferase involved in cell wall biosynthesis
MPDHNDIRVSYIISTRNRAEFLEKALENVREYITAEDELIVVDGASTDNTAEVVESNRDIVHLFISEPDCGEAHGFNKGILASRGRFIKVLTDDDYFYPDAMRQAIATMESHPELDAIICGGEVYSLEPGEEVPKLVRYLCLPCAKGGGYSFVETLGHLFCGLGLLLRREAVARVGLFDTSFRCVDTDYIARLIECRVTFRYLNVKLYRHTRYPHSSSRVRNECNRDWYRVLMRSREWEAMTGSVDQCQYVAEALGLDKLPNGGSLTRIIYYAERLRRRGWPVLKTAVWFLDLLTRTRDSLFKCVNGLARRPAAGGEQTTPTENAPDWDGTLR